jgi:hypothetical protein
MLLRRTLIPTLGQSLISENEMGISKRCWQMRMTDGCQLECFLLFDPQLGAVLKLTVKGSQGEDVRATEIAQSLRQLLEERGAVALEAVE